MKGYNAYVGMDYGGNNILTRIIDVIKENGLELFTPDEVSALLNEGGKTPFKSVQACISSKTEGFHALGNNRAYFVRVGKGFYRLK